MEEMIDVEVNLGKEEAEMIKKSTKVELINRLVISELHRRVQLETIDKYEQRLDELRKELWMANYKLKITKSLTKNIIESID